MKKQTSRKRGLRPALRINSTSLLEYAYGQRHGCLVDAQSIWVGQEKKTYRRRLVWVLLWTETLGWVVVLSQVATAADSKEGL